MRRSFDEIVLAEDAGDKVKTGVMERILGWMGREFPQLSLSASIYLVRVVWGMGNGKMRFRNMDALI
jgi:hypothetical protein